MLSHRDKAKQRDYIQRQLFFYMSWVGQDLNPNILLLCAYQADAVSNELPKQLMYILAGSQSKTPQPDCTLTLFFWHLLGVTSPSLGFGPLLPSSCITAWMGGWGATRIAKGRRGREEEGRGGEREGERRKEEGEKGRERERVKSKSESY